MLIVRGTRAMRISQLQDQIGRGEYRVDPQAVADAILRRLLEGRLASSAAPKPAQSECS
jgi:hypothetical protein